MKKDLPSKHAIVQSDKETYAIAPHLPGGFVTTSQLRSICDVAEKYGVRALKLTSAQRIALIGIREEDLDKVWIDLGMTPGAVLGHRVRSVKICPGSTCCKRGVQDSVSLGLELDRRYHGMELPNKLKIGVSGCLVSCAEAAVKDIGILGTLKGWRILVGGSAGPRPRLADMLIDNVSSQDEVLALVDKIMTFCRMSTNHNRLGRIIDSVGIERFRQEMLGPI
ncbi:NAD(P)/FAD-dependent oxidoreductase [Geobacter sp. DSM 9736]|uniref:NAD(P)/FAD-dependent oxidoreductase n=1 Tax=Geobacter sp. DSM 9736 TaxID=1277350 RepID=UPI000B50FBD4|nr:NAD(P)/FAD-dependent oxidoreductase [Geobacter sp. DSM 9736]SNB47552.1 Nitrite/Sulfite reductase ferredoxin-like half domain-containing protein [Geobacter sp. DSM 9736]